MSGTVIAQGLMIASAPILSRLYNPEAFGIFSLYTSVVSIWAVVSTWRYELAIVLPKKDEDAASILFLSCLIVLLMSVLSMVFILIFGDWLAAMLGSSKLKPWLWWVPISIFGTGLYQSLNYWSTRRKSFKRLSISQVLRSTGVVTTQISGGIGKLGASGLIGGQVAGQLIASIVLGFQVWKDDRYTLRKPIRFSRLKKQASEHSKFPKYSAPQALLNSISQNLPPILLAYFFNPAVVGLYALSLKLLQLPINLVGESVRQVFYQKISEAYNNKQNTYRLLKKATIGLALIAIIPTLIIILYGPELLSFVLGDEWFEAGIYARWMVFWLFFAFVNRPSFTMYNVLGLQKYLLFYDGLLLIGRVFAMAVGGIYYSPIESIVFYSFVGAAFNLWLILFIHVKDRKRMDEVK